MEDENFLSLSDMKGLFKNIRQSLIKIDSFLENYDKRFLCLEEMAGLKDKPIPRILTDYKIEMQIDEACKTYLNNNNNDTMKETPNITDTFNKEYNDSDYHDLTSASASWADDVIMDLAPSASTSPKKVTTKDQISKITFISYEPSGLQ